jgi:hypothetical protein
MCGAAAAFLLDRAREASITSDHFCHTIRRQCEDMIRLDAGREIDRLASCWRSCRKRVRPGTDRRKCAQMHLLPERRRFVLRLGVQLDPYGARIEAAEIYFDLKCQVSVLRSYVQCAEVNVLPVSRDLLLPREKFRDL